MRTLCRSLSLVALTFALLFTTSTGPLRAQGTPSYGVNDLGAFLIPMAMSEGGFPLLAGSRETPPSTESHGFVGAVGFFRPLGTLGGPSSVARATNGGVAAGESQTPSGAYHAFVADFRGLITQMTDIGTLGGSQSRAYGVNDFNVVVGGSDVTGDTGLRQAFIYQNGVISPLGATLGGSATFAFDINNNNQVVGYADLPGTPGSSRAFLYANGSTVNLGSLGGRSVAYAINDAGVVVGDSALSGFSPLHAFRWENGVMRDLGTLGGANSSAAAVSADGHVVVGWAEDAQGARRAVMWRDGTLVDLNTLIPPGTDWELVGATGIGFKDAVIGYGRRADGALHGFMLTPPFDVELSLSNHENEEATNFPNPHEVGPLLLGVTVNNHGDFAPTGVTIRDSITGPIEYVSWDGGDCAADRTVGHQTLTCTVAPFESRGRDIMIQTRSTGPGSIAHAAEIISSGHLDSNPANDAATETNTAVALSSLTLANTTVTGGAQVFTVATLTSPAPTGGARVTLTSSNPAVATVPSPFDVIPGQNGGLFRETYVTTRPVSAPVTVAISASYGMRTITRSLTIMPAGSSWPFRDTRRAIPGIIQAEDFDEGGEGAGYHDTSRGNDGGKYRSTDVDVETTADSGGGYNVGWMAAGEWLGYAVNVQSGGAYRLTLRVAANGAGGRLHVEFDGVDKTGTMTIPNTGGWQAWRDISAQVTLAAGAQRMRIVVDGAGATGVVGNLNYVTLTRVTPAPSDIVIYAADVSDDRIHGSWSKQADSTSPGGVKLQTTDLGVSHTGSPLASPVDYFDASFEAVADQPYALWLRLKALGNSKFNDAVWVQFSGAVANGGPVYRIDGASGLLVNLATDATASSLSNWGWQNGAYWLMQATTFTFPASGTQTIRVQVREDGVQVDQIVLSPNAYRNSSPGAVSNDTVIVATPR